ncbi:MAG: DUF2490 domain-containing protein [Acidobacteriaceae bacterium]|nr:DUF2490 domain-containing protein [Acidobacteriaceae bacterium]
MRATALLIVSAATALLPSGSARAQQSNQFWPEIDAYVQMTQNTRLFLIASSTREEDARAGAQIGANLDIFTKPWLKLKRLGIFELDPSVNRPLVLSVGYRHLMSANGQYQERILAQGTMNFPLKLGVLVSNRSRFDMTFTSGNFSWVYRDRLAAQKTYAIRGYRFTPFIRGELFFTSAFKKWTTTALSAGAVFPLLNRYELQPYYEHQNNTGTAPNSQVESIGLQLKMYFRQNRQ